MNNRRSQLMTQDLTQKDIKGLNPLSEEEREIIEDIRGLRFGKVLISIQDGVIIQKEITRTIKNAKKQKNTKF